MPNDIRAVVLDDTFFFTVNLLERRRRLLSEHIDDPRSVFADARRRRPYGPATGIPILPAASAFRPDIAGSSGTATLGAPRSSAARCA